jgi:RimJ/RimL family protein N-acetyltransferase
MNRPVTEWICAGTRCRRVPAGLNLGAVAHAPVPRLRRESWVRYRLTLDGLPPSPAGIHLTPIDASLMELLRLHPERDEHQVRSAFRFWQIGFGDGFLWMEKGEPLCMIWLLTSRHMAARAGLGTWAGIYPPLDADAGMAEGIYSFRRGLRRPGGAATLMAQALFHKARGLGLRELRTHIHEENLAARRWAARLGWQPVGRIHRCFLDLRGLRASPVYLHEREEVGELPPVGGAARAGSREDASESASPPAP